MYSLKYCTTVYMLCSIARFGQIKHEAQWELIQISVRVMILTRGGTPSAHPFLNIVQ